MSEPLPSPPLRRAPVPSLEAMRRLGSSELSWAPGTTSQFFLALGFLSFQPVMSLPLKRGWPLSLSAAERLGVKMNEARRTIADAATRVMRLPSMIGPPIIPARRRFVQKAKGVRACLELAPRRNSVAAGLAPG